MGAFILLILFQVSVHGFKGPSKYGWFWDKRVCEVLNPYWAIIVETIAYSLSWDDDNDFSDGTQHDYDAEREFFRHHSRSPPIQTTPTDDDTVSSATETQDHHLDKSSYYKERKHQALACKNSEHVKLTMDEFGGVGCQMCTCNSQGMMLCTHIACKESGEDVVLDHGHILDNSVHTIKDLRGIADGCDQGTAKKVGKCTCTCVLPKVLSCPRECFYEIENHDTPTHDYNDNKYISPADSSEGRHITTEDYYDNTEITTENYDDDTTDDNYDNAETTPEDDTTTKEDYDDKVDKDENKDEEDEKHNEEKRHLDKDDKDGDTYVYILINFGPRVHKTKKTHRHTVAAAVRA